MLSFGEDSHLQSIALKKTKRRYTIDTSKEKVQILFYNSVQSSLGMLVVCLSEYIAAQWHVNKEQIMSIHLRDLNNVK